MTSEQLVLALALTTVAVVTQGCGGDSSAPAGPSFDAALADTQTTDTQTAETNTAEDTTPSSADSAVADTSAADTKVADTATSDTTVVDSALADTPALDSAKTDTAIADTAVADTAVADTAVTPGTFLSRAIGGRAYRLYVPAGYVSTTALPLVVMLHGCDQSPTDFAVGTRMNSLADTRRFLVAYPEQPTSAQPFRCWQWYEPAHQARGAGEPASIASVVTDVKGSYSVDAKRIYAAGISSGAAMTVILGATYPDVFTAIAVHSGVEYAGANSATSSYTTLSSGGPAPTTQGDAAYTAMGTFKRVVPTLVIHGDADAVVAPVNGAQVVAQWVRTNDRAGDGLANGTVPTTPTTSSSGSSGGRTFTHATYVESTTSAVVVDSYVVQGLPHAWSGGDLTATYTAPGPNASTWVADFFAAHVR